MDEAKQVPPVGVRLPHELKIWIKQRALNNLRSVNSEIVSIFLELKRTEATKRDGSMREGPTQ
jgi:hypothetical protein